MQTRHNFHAFVHVVLERAILRYSSVLKNCAKLTVKYLYQDFSNNVAGLPVTLLSVK